MEEDEEGRRAVRSRAGLTPADKAPSVHVFVPQP